MSNTRKGPVFIVGNSRSGTTVLSMGLGNHADIFSFRELHFFEKFWSPNWDKQNDHEPAAHLILEKLICGQREGFLYCKDPSVYNKDAQQLLDSTGDAQTIKLEEVYAAFLYGESKYNNKPVPCEQTPHNVFYLKKIFTFFPEAKVIAMVRDPRDILLSQKKKSKIRRTGKGEVPVKERIRTWSNYHPYIMSQMWNRVSAEIEKWKDDERVMVVKFEDLVSDPLQMITSISQFIGVDFQSAMLDVPQIGSSNVTDSADKVGLNSDVTNKWKKGLSAAEIVICQKINERELREYGYEYSDIKTNIFSIAFQVFMLPVKAVLALTFNMGRSKNVLQSIIKRLVK